MKKYMSLYPSCKITRGIGQSCIHDLERNVFLKIPNTLFDLLAKRVNIDIEAILSQYEAEDKNILLEYISFLDTHKLIYTSPSEQNIFADMADEETDFPFEFYNMIVELERESIDSILQQEAFFNKVAHIELRIYRGNNFLEYQQILQMFQDSRCLSVTLLISHLNKNPTIEDLQEVLSKYPKVEKIYCFSSYELKNITHTSDKIFFLKSDLTSCKQCGIITMRNFTPNIFNYLNGKKYNSCLNRKISIDTQGNIKNCPSMAQSFGNIQNTTLAEALNHPDFKKYWNITKDQVSVCKDCEFRYICTDCRAYLENPEDRYSKPLKCGYNPYTNVWEEWSANPLKQKAIAYYGIETTLLHNEKKPIHNQKSTKNK